VKHLLLVSLILFTVAAFGDTPPPGTVKAKTFSGDGVTSIGASGSSLNVDVTSSALATNACQETGGNLAAILSKLNSSIAVTGTFWQATQPVSAASLPLPTGAATSANQTNASQKTQIVDGSGNVIASTGNALNVSVGSIVLPTGAATAALQTSGNTLLSTINTTLGSPFQAGGSIGNTAFGISGTLPAFTSTPTFNLGTLNGAATAANQATEITDLATIASNTTNAGTPVVSGSVTVTQATGTNLHTVVDSSALPTGAATSSLQTTGNTSLSTIVTNTGNIPAQGQALAAGSLPVVLPAAQITTLTPPTSVTVTQATGTNLHTAVDSSALPTGASTSALQTTGNTSLSSIDGKTPSLGQALSAASVPVVLPAAQITTLTPPTSVTVTQGTGSNLHVTVDSAPTTAVTGTFWQATQPVSGTFWQATQPVSAASLPLPTGASTSAKQPALGTAGSASSDVLTVQGIASMTALKVDGSAVTQPVSQAPSALTIHQATVTIGTSAVRLTYNGSAPASTRVLLVAQLDAASPASCYFGSSSVTTSSTTQGVQMFAGQTYSFNNDAGDYYAICGSSSQSFHITEQE
jgi:hypothetical protein